ncbi:TPM domain-containing protein [Halovulum dunhuangense]|uniref:TPM domain-containing protein n=1 Tax=Halovulum dunhuangense TaxID=1505036 RepID=A0A849L4P2_9RHOB|nr:TPM domain-containing protein [Halovulum dunhuangense]NNU81170.1 TPM domain-containing protein [Halovulum dunhuangense]
MPPGLPRWILLALAGLVALGLGLGYTVGRLNAPAPVVQPGVARAPAELDPPGSATGPLGQRAGDLPGWEDLYVNDYADLLDPEAEARVRGQLEELYDATGIEMTLLTIESRIAYGNRSTNEEFATALFNDWGIGDATRNDGVLILVSERDREMRIELGAGYGFSRDADMARVIDTEFLPLFVRERYQDGILVGVEATIREIAGAGPGEYAQGTVQRGLGTIWRFLGDMVSRMGEWALALLVLPAWGAASAWRAWRRHRPRDCPDCGRAMVRQSDEALDDQHLSGGQRLEEFLASVDYDVWECPGCTHMEITRWPRIFSGHGTCKACGFRTLGSTTTVLESATKSREGRKRIDYACEQCGHAFTEERSIPRLSDSSSGSGRSSFGGGRSSGGGASGSW